jgi:hypothetical protein
MKYISHDHFKYQESLATNIGIGDRDIENIITLSRIVTKIVYIKSSGIRMYARKLRKVCITALLKMFCCMGLKCGH